ELVAAQRELVQLGHERRRQLAVAGQREVVAHLAVERRQLGDLGGAGREAALLERVERRPEALPARPALRLEAGELHERPSSQAAIASSRARGSPPRVSAAGISASSSPRALDRSGTRSANAITAPCSSSVSGSGGGTGRSAISIAASRSARRRRSACTTIVPAARSPSRRKLGSRHIEVIPARYNRGRKSATRRKLRRIDAGQPMGVPFSCTTRSPTMRLPGVCPWDKTSKHTP